MEIIVSGRHLTVGNDLKEYVEDKLTPIIEHKSLKISSIRVILSHEKARQKAEVIVSLKNLQIETDTETYDMYEAIDTTIDKMSKQIQKYLDKLQDHHKRPATRDLTAPEEEVLSELEEEFEDLV